VLDVAVVGAGVGGCYCAYRLVTDAGPGNGIALFEQTDRIGGRLWSQPMRDAPHLIAELGAMRLHRGLRSALALVRHLGLDLAPFEFGRPENLVHRRGVAVRCREMPGDRIVEAAERLVPGFAELRRRHHEAEERGDRHRSDSLLDVFREQRDQTRVSGRPLDELTWPHALDFALGPAAVAFLHDTGGYDLRRSGENAATQLDLVFRTPPDAEYVTLRHGMQGLPDALHARFTAAGGTTHTGHRLARLDKDADHYRLTFATPGEDRHTLARAVVLALPPEALRRLDGLPLARHLRPALDAVEPVPAFKLFLVYPRPWWRELGITRGRSTTDTALRQLWYGGTCPATEPTGPALLLAAYPSGHSVHAWAPWRGGPPHPAAGAGHAPAAAMVEHAHTLLARMHDLPDLERPLSACRQDWTDAWHVWRPGHDPRVIGPRTRQPIPGEAIHVVGDCWTPDPGSIEGTLASADDLLRVSFGLPDPQWHTGPPR
jgi:monoamine oxidase